MKALVAIKRVIDHNIRIQVKADFSNVETSNLKMSMNPFDEIALEEALLLHEAGKITEVIVVTVGPQGCQETLRAALALGAHRGIHVETNTETQPLGIAKVLKEIVQEESPEIVILGKQAIDDDCNQTGQMLAGMLKWPQGTFISKLEIIDNKIHIVREVDGGNEFLKLRIPAILTVDLRLNQPRYATLPNIIKAKQKPVRTLTVEELGIDIKPRHRTLRVDPSFVKREGLRLENVHELIDKLKHDAKVIS